MICHIADASLAAEAISWPVLPARPGPGGARSLTPNRAQQQVAGEPAPTGEGGAAELERRLSEPEGRRPFELAEARREGVEEGLRQGRGEAMAETQKAFDHLARALHDLSQTKSKIRREAEEELVKLSLAVARRILYRELAADPSVIEGIVHAALQKLAHREASRVRVYPAGAAAVRAALDRIGSRTGIEVVPDAGLETGSLLFETSSGELDASIETQLQEIQRGFADRLAVR